MPWFKVGLEPSVVKRISDTPEPPESSVALSVTEIGALNQPEPQAAPLHAIVEVGAVVSVEPVSIVISWLLIASALPATSKARYLTVVVVETVNAAE